MARRFALVLFGLCASAAGGAAAQEGAWYRDGVPAVLGPSAAAAPGKVAGDFGAQYRRHGSPRMAVFWMRRLSDRTVPEMRTVERVDEAFDIGATGNTRSSATAWGMAVPSWGRVDRYGRVDTETQSSGMVSGQRSMRRELHNGPVMDESDDWLPEEVSLAAEASLFQELRRAGVKLVDRNTILRLQGAAGASNPQAVEAAALRAKADLLVEIVATPSWDSETGVLYRVDVKDLRSGQLVAAFTTPAEPRAGAAAQFTTRPGRGYVESRSGTPLGQEIAWQLMEQVGAAWRR
ncbi:MAG TPA: hypothetical protein VD860_06065 [Azospirillum sp.]|nr:hypothetical protein [Azospirillum sp.]